MRRRIEERNVSYEKNSPATSLNYLKTLENTYKKQYLKDIRYAGFFRGAKSDNFPAMK